jgi:hypothetical protein
LFDLAHGRVAGHIWDFGSRTLRTKQMTQGATFGCPHEVDEQLALEFHEGRLGVFDNRDATEGSRAAEYLVDERARTATLEWSYTPEDPQYALVLGDTTRREDGSHLIAWGSTGDIVVTDADSTLSGLLRMEQPLAIGAVSEVGVMP